MIKKIEQNLTLLTVLFSVLIVVSNVISAKLLQTPFTFFKTPLQLPGSAFLYVFTFFISNIISEVWGKEAATKAVRLGLISQITAMIVFFLTQLLPAADNSYQDAYILILGRNSVFVIADIFAGFTSQLINVLLYNMQRVGNKVGKGKFKGLISYSSIMISQLFDTVAFIGIAFGVGSKWLWTTAGIKSLIAMCLGQYLIKAVVALVFVPIFHIVTSRKENG